MLPEHLRKIFRSPEKKRYDKKQMISRHSESCGRDKLCASHAVMLLQGRVIIKQCALVPKGIVHMLCAHAWKSVCRPASHVFGVIQNRFKMECSFPEVGRQNTGASGVEMC